MQRQKRAIGGKPGGGFRNGLTLAEKPAEGFAGGGVPVRPDIRLLEIEDRDPVAGQRPMPRIRRRWVTRAAVARSAPRGSLLVSFQAGAQGGPRVCWIRRHRGGLTAGRRSRSARRFHPQQQVRGHLGVGQRPVGATGDR